jgi:hypothetical protein
MKTIFTLLLASFFTTAAFAYDEGRLSVTIASKTNVQVFIDGRAYQDNDNQFVVQSIQAGNHTIKVYRARGNDNNRNRGNANRNSDLLYSSTVYVRPAYHVDVMINRFGKALVDERALNDRTNGSWDDDRYPTNNNYGNYGNNGNNGSYNSNRAMADNEFNQFLSQIRNQWFAADKMKAAREGLSRNYFTTVQIRQLVPVFVSEADRLELAKLSYRNIVDQQNFRQLYDQFSYQGQTELDNYVRNFR